MSSDDEYNYGSSNNDEELSDGDEIVISDVEESDVVAKEMHHLKKNCTILKREEINQRLNEDIYTVSTFLKISRGAACSLLRYFNWRVENVYEQWFADEDNVREAIGLMKQSMKQSITDSNSLSLTNKSGCMLCFDDFSSKNPRIMISASCAHLLCIECWKKIMNLSINNGPECLNLRCPVAHCKALVDLDLIDFIASDEDKKKYREHLERSYVVDSKKRKWCPAPECDFLVEYNDNDAGETYDVTCNCSYKFCWNCNEESHSPADCEIVKMWNSKMGSVTDNVLLWKMAYTKPCPNCYSPIEKDSTHIGKRVRCPCGHSFCWSCLGNHCSVGVGFEESSDLGFGSRLRLESGLDFKVGDGFTRCCDNTNLQEEKNRKIVKRNVERYAQCYEKWSFYDKSKKDAMVNLSQAKTELVEKLATSYRKSNGELEFLTDAWEQIVECMRVLKWSYAYEFFLSDDDERKNISEYLKGDAESALKRLQDCAEKEIEAYIQECGAPLKSDTEFEDFCKKLAYHTALTKKAFESLTEVGKNCPYGVGVMKK